jgi:23S rRNA (adenine2503-C2)-methyltransferase
MDNQASPPPGEASPLPPLSGLLPAEIVASCSLDKSFQGKQIFKWIARGADSFDLMTDLSASLRSRLAESFRVRSSTIGERLADSDGTVKIALALSDGNVVECVLLVDSEGRKTACLSSQVGCPMGCAFCRTGQLGFARNLEASEIVDQFLVLNAEFGPLQNIVFMGMGEPLLNLEAVRKAIAILTHADGLGLSRRRITLSTSGLVEGIRDLADNGPDVRLAVSLTAADPAVRTPLMPITRSNPLPELREALLYYQEKTKDRITLEAVLIGGVNTAPGDVDALRAFIDGLQVTMNLIPWNRVPGMDFREPTRQELEDFESMLEERGIQFTQRARRGRGVSGACGQLGTVIRK